MIITAKGKLNFAMLTCSQCSGTLYAFHKSNLRCSDCGANYEKIEERTEDLEWEIDYKLSGFKCRHHDFLTMTYCDNDCPTSHMFCEEHISEKEFVRAKEMVRYNEKALESSKLILESMEQSKKNWLVNKLSGLK